MYSDRFQCELKVILSLILDKIKLKSENVLNTGAGDYNRALALESTSV